MQKTNGDDVHSLSVQVQSDQNEKPKPQEILDLDPQLVEVIRSEARSASYAVIRSEYHSGPMPSPRQLEEYDKVLPGLATEIKDEFLKNGQHVRESERQAIEYTKNDNDKNRRVAERLVWGSLICSVVLALAGHDWVAGILAGTTVVAVITGFLQNRSKKQQENTEIEE